MTSSKKGASPRADDPPANVSHLWACTLADTGVFCAASDDHIDLTEDEKFEPLVYDDVTIPSTNPPMEYIAVEPDVAAMEEFGISVDRQSPEELKVSLENEAREARVGPWESKREEHRTKREGSKKASTGAAPRRVYFETYRDKVGAKLCWGVILMLGVVGIIWSVRPVLLKEAGPGETNKAYYTVGFEGLLDVGVLDDAGALSVDVSSVVAAGAAARALVTGSGCSVTYAVDGTTLVVSGAPNATAASTPWLCAAGAEVTYFVSASDA